MAVYGNVNVKYAPCKSVAQLHSAADYILGKKKEQLSSGVIKTKSELYNAFGCNRDNFANSVLMTRKMHQKKYSRFFPRDILAQKLSISFHPEDNDKLTYAEAYKMAEDFAREFFWKKGFEVLFAVHVDTEHVHVHFLVNNCNQKDGSSFRRGPKELVEMSEYFGEQCRSRSLTHSVRDSFYNPDKTREERTFAESQMEKRGKLSFKDEIRVFIRLAMNDPTTQNIHDVVNMLERTYQSMKDYPRWEEDEDEVKEFASKAKKQVPTQESQPTRKPDVSVYEAYDEFQEKHEIPENDESFFYAVFNAAAEAFFRYCRCGGLFENGGLNPSAVQIKRYMIKRLSDTSPHISRIEPGHTKGEGGTEMLLSASPKREIVKRGRSNEPSKRLESKSTVAFSSCRENSRE
ncbi:relaxase/mobilization nuclease domain-containing protein [[Ruminococcus] lactaris]|uniref:relaxase/mobilization nuclease domain-containing protein n=1 Tax=[Ruminococcus] lactaris TaxID=46228 RepID=UPI00307BE4D7